MATPPKKDPEKKPTPKKRRENIDKALDRVRRAKGGTTGGVSGSGSVKGGSGGGSGGRVTFRDASGKVVSVVAGGRTAAQVIADRNAEISMQTASTRQKNLEAEAKQKVGTVRRIEKRGNQITYIGATGKRTTIANLPKVTRQNIIRKEKALVSKTKQVSTPLMGTLSKVAKQKAIKALKLERGRTAATIGALIGVSSGKAAAEKARLALIDKRLRKLQREGEDIIELEQEAAKRSQRAADIYRAVPGLGGDNFAQKTIRNFLAIPVRSTVGVAEQAVIAGFKAQLLLKALQTKETREAAKAEAKRAGIKTPGAIAKGFNPTTPEGLANILGVVVYGGLLRGKASGSKVKAGLKTTAKSLKKSNPKVANSLNKASRNPSLIKRIVKSAKKFKTKVRLNKFRQGFKKEAKLVKAQELLGKIKRNTQTLRNLKTQLKAFRKMKTRTPQERLSKTQTLKSIRGKINRINKVNKSLDRQITKAGFPKGARGRLKAIEPKTPKVPKVKKPRSKVIVKAKLKPKARRLLAKVRKRIARTENKIQKSVTKFTNKISRKGLRIVKKPLRTAEKTAIKSVVPLEKALAKIAKKGTRAIKITARSLKKFGLKVEKLGRLGERKIGKATVRLTNKLANLNKRLVRRGLKIETKAIKNINKINKEIIKNFRIVGKKILSDTDRSLLRAVKILNKKLPFKTKITIVKSSGKTISFPRRFRFKKGGKPYRLPGGKKLAKVTRENFIVKQILKGKRKLRASDSARIKKKVRTGIRKGLAGKDFALRRKAIGKAKKQTRIDLKKQQLQEVLGLAKASRDIKRIFKKQDKFLAKIGQKPIPKSKGNPSKTVSNNLNKANKVARETGSKNPITKQEAVQILKPAKQAAKAKTKTTFKQKINQFKKNIAKATSKVKTALRNKRIPASVAKPSSKVVQGLLFVGLQAIARNKFARQGIRLAPPSKKQEEKPKAKIITKQQPKQETVPKIKEEPIIIPDTRIDTLPKARQAAIINSIIVSALGTQAIRRGTGRVVKVPQTRLRGGIANLRKFIYSRLRKKPKVFTPDIYSVIFGIRARPRERIKLLKPGRFFTGVERRKLV